MQKTYSLRNRILRAAVFALPLTLILGPSAVPAHAVSKETVELQTQVQQLLDMVQRLQSTVDTKFAQVQGLVQQTVDQSNQMTATVNALQKQVQTQNEAVGGKTDALSGQMQSLNDSIDEVKSRIAKLDKTIQDLQTQIQTMQSQPAPAAAPGAMPGTTPGMGPGTGPGSTPGGASPAGGQAIGPGGQAGVAPAGPPAQQAPPLNETFQAGLRDFGAGRYELASSEFTDIVHFYPLDDHAGSAQFYLGEIAYHQKNYADAVTFYDAVLTGFSGNPNASAAQLHKGLALLAENKKEAGIKELRSVIERHPQTPEAMQARSKLNSMGVRIVPTPAH